MSAAAGLSCGAPVAVQDGADMSDIMTLEELGEIEARAESATDGPWHHYRDVAGLPDIPVVGCYDDARRDYVAICDCWGQDFDVPRDRDYRADADFIAHAREDVPALVAEVRRLRRASGLYCGYCAQEVGLSDGVRIRTIGAPNPFCSMDCAKSWKASQ